MSTTSNESTLQPFRDIAQIVLQNAPPATHGALAQTCSWINERIKLYRRQNGLDFLVVDIAFLERIVQAQAWQVVTRICIQEMLLEPKHPMPVTHFSACTNLDTLFIGSVACAKLEKYYKVNTEFELPPNVKTLRVVAQRPLCLEFKRNAQRLECNERQLQDAIEYTL
jgi:hypothetical protein